MSEISSLKAEILALEAQAMQAYKFRDFKLEDQIDSKLAPLRKRLSELVDIKCPKCKDYFSPSQIDETGLCWHDSDRKVHPSHKWLFAFDRNDPLETTRMMPLHNFQNQRCSNCAVKQYHPQAHFACRRQDLNQSGTA